MLLFAALPAEIVARKSNLPIQHFDALEDLKPILEFKHWFDEWFARRMGCGRAPEPPKDLPPGTLINTQLTCYDAASYRDNDSWRKARELAKIVFDLGEVR